MAAAYGRLAEANRELGLGAQPFDKDHEGIIYHDHIDVMEMAYEVLRKAQTYHFANVPPPRVLQ